MSPAALLIALAATSSTATATVTTTATAANAAPASSGSATAVDPERREVAGVTMGIRGQIFIRAQQQKTEGEAWERIYRLQRVRLQVELGYGDFLKAVIEPEFADAFCAAAGAVCGEVDLADAYLDLGSGAFDVRVGHAKAPYGAFESISEWKLPAQERGLVSDVVSDRLGFGGRHLGVRARLRLKRTAWKPSLELGGYVDLENASAEDAAFRLGVKPMKSLDLRLAGYTRAGALGDGSHGFAGAVDAEWSDGVVLVLAEVQLSRARLLRRDGIDTGANSTLIAARALAAYAIALDDQRLWELEPYAGVDVVDPNTETTDDVGAAVRGGLNLYRARNLRFGVEVEHRASALAFVEPESTTIALFAGASLE